MKTTPEWKYLTWNYSFIVMICLCILLFIMISVWNRLFELMATQAAIFIENFPPMSPRRISIVFFMGYQSHATIRYVISSKRICVRECVRWRVYTTFQICHSFILNFMCACVCVYERFQLPFSFGIKSLWNLSYVTFNRKVWWIIAMC